MFDLLAAIGVLVILGGAMLITKLCAEKLTPEASRKIIHITMGCVALSFPYIFTYKLSVVCLGIAAVSMLLFLRLNKYLREGIGTALLGISRKSFGEIYFVISIVTVFIWHKSTFEYLIPISVLTFADSVAALIGTSYGRHNLAHTQEDAKSGEGSVMFFIVAFICTLVPLQLMTQIGRAEVLVISFLIGLLAAMIEAVSTNGNDNLLLPLLTYSFLRYNSEQSLDLLFFNFGVMLVFLAAIYLVYKMTSITKLSVAYSLLVGYVVMILGGAFWIFPPLMLLLTFGILPMMRDEEKKVIYTYKVMECNSTIGIICLYGSVLWPQYRDALYLAFSFSFACHLTINMYCRFVNFLNASEWFAVICGLSRAAVFIFLPTLFITRMNWAIAAAYLALMAAVIPPAASLNKKYDHKIMRNETARKHKFFVGTLTAIFFTIILITGEIL